MKIVIYGLTITSSWGNGHATTYRSLLKALNRRGHMIHFIERNVEWYSSNADLPDPDFCTVHRYDSIAAELESVLLPSLSADVVVVGSYFPDTAVVTQALKERGGYPVLFYDIDTPITLAGLRRDGRTDYLDGALIPAYDCYLSFTGGPALRELKDVFGARRAVPFFCSVDADMYKATKGCDAFRSDLSYLGTYAADRQPKLMELLDRVADSLPDQSFLVAGPLYPAGLTWHSNVKRIAHVAPPEHPDFYSSSRFTLNVTRDDMVNAGYSPSVRLFEASACGATILSDTWTGIGDFLTPGEEILLPQSTADVAEILTGISDVERNRIGKRARARILAEHTSDHRALEFEQIVSDCG